MNKLLFLIPSGYFIKTRLNTKAALLFHGYAEYLLGILLLYYAGIDAFPALRSFILSYLAFISLYEIGYIFNDFISVRFEKNPRKRLAAWQPSNLIIIAWIVIRIVFFLFLSYYLNVINVNNWWYFYALLIVAFSLHNILEKKEYKIFTFVTLACIRFYAPLFLFLPTTFLLLTIPPVLLHYVFFRTLTYIDSKDLLRIPGRSSLSFKTAYYITLLPLSALLAIFSAHWLCVWINLYFLIFWGSLFTIGKLGVISNQELKTD